MDTKLQAEIRKIRKDADYFQFLANCARENADKLEERLGVPLCRECGCAGNESCGHKSVDDKMGCTLDDAGFCPCCNQPERGGEK